MSGNLVLKIGDFGLCTPPTNSHIDTDFNQALSVEQVGTALYCAPEAMSKVKMDSVDKAQSAGQYFLFFIFHNLNKNILISIADMFALGIILCEMLQRFSTSMERARVLGNLRAGLGMQTMIKDKYPIECAVIGQLLHLDPTQRPTCSQLLSSEVRTHFIEALFYVFIYFIVLWVSHSKILFRALSLQNTTILKEMFVSRVVHNIKSLIAQEV